MFCSNCGVELPNEAKFCSNCGEKVKDQSPSSNQEENLVNSPFSCPICKKSDQAQKVSAIVDYDTHNISGTGQTWVPAEKGGYWANIPISGTQVSVLARKLSAPIKPEEKSSSCLMIALGLLLLGSGILGLLYTILVITEGQLEFDAFAATLILLFSGGMIFRSINKHNKQETNRVANERPLWEKAMTVWNRLYYCFRDDIVFDPTNQQTCFPQEITKLYPQKEEAVNLS